MYIYIYTHTYCDILHLFIESTKNTKYMCSKPANLVLQFSAVQIRERHLDHGEGEKVIERNISVMDPWPLSEKVLNPPKNHTPNTAAKKVLGSIVP